MPPLRMEGQSRVRGGVRNIFIPYKRTGGGQEAREHNGSIVPMPTSYGLLSLTLSGGEGDKRGHVETSGQGDARPEMNVAKAITILCRTSSYRGPVHICVSGFHIISSLSS